jgi:hypothetical protein
VILKEFHFLGDKVWIVKPCPNQMIFSSFERSWKGLLEAMSIWRFKTQNPNLQKNPIYLKIHLEGQMESNWKALHNFENIFPITIIWCNGMFDSIYFPWIMNPQNFMRCHNVDFKRRLWKYQFFCHWDVVPIYIWKIC